ncbi:MAG: hypothetical protein JJU05_09450 [Verrucomicrobia bacterium]|nr:hypothetical protein [Verrucomicrobiota bacterium]MCH8526023.1 hypothetical protein [Kiritimatiellia bacterium]
MHTPPLWKEGRQGAVSLCYLGLNPPERDWVLAHHAAVGIRASRVCDRAEPCLSLPVERNWDLLSDREDADLHTALSALDGRSERGCFVPETHPAVPAGTLYTLSTREEVIEAPEPDLSKPLPSFAVSADADFVLDWIECVVAKGHWLILRLDAKCLSEMNRAGHQTLLQRLGDHHARIWCAPVRDIATWR